MHTPPPSSSGTMPPAQSAYHSQGHEKGRGGTQKIATRTWIGGRNDHHLMAACDQPRLAPAAACPRTSATHTPSQLITMGGVSVRGPGVACHQTCDRADRDRPRRLHPAPRLPHNLHTTVKVMTRDAAAPRKSRREPGLGAVTTMGDPPPSTHPTRCWNSTPARLAQRPSRFNTQGRPWSPEDGADDRDQGCMNGCREGGCTKDQRNA